MKVKLTLDALIRQIEISRDDDVDWGKTVVVDGLPVSKEDEKSFYNFVEEFGSMAQYFTNTQLCILNELHQRKGKPVKSEIFYKYFKYSRHGLLAMNLAQQISKIRRKAKEHNIPFRIVNIRQGYFNNDGYYMEAE